MCRFCIEAIMIGTVGQEGDVMLLNPRGLPWDSLQEVRDLEAALSNEVTLEDYLDQWCASFDVEHCRVPDPAVCPKVNESARDYSATNKEVLVTALPQLIAAISLLARLEPDADIIRQVAFAGPINLGFEGEGLWLQRRAFAHTSAAQGVPFLIAYLDHYDTVERWTLDDAVVRNELFHYGVMNTLLSATDGKCLIDALYAKPWLPGGDIRADATERTAGGSSHGCGS